MTIDARFAKLLNADELARFDACGGDLKRFFRTLPEDVMAGILEEIAELEEVGRGAEHWAWRFVAPSLALA